MHPPIHFAKALSRKASQAYSLNDRQGVQGGSSLFCIKISCKGERSQTRSLGAFQMADVSLLVISRMDLHLRLQRPGRAGLQHAPTPSRSEIRQGCGETVLSSLCQPRPINSTKTLDPNGVGAPRGEPVPADQGANSFKTVCLRQTASFTRCLLTVDRDCLRGAPPPPCGQYPGN